MYHVFIVTDREAELDPFTRALDAEGITYASGTTENDLHTSSNGAQELNLDAVLIDLDGLGEQQTRRLAPHCRQLGIPVIAIVSTSTLADFDPSLNLDDLIILPFRPGELTARLGQAIFRIKGPQGRDLLRVGDLLIDLERYEVSLGGRKVLLTYKEYQLLVLLASNQGKVYTRENLLSNVWGYDYFGGTRTVDVHVRRLRAKIEDGDHAFIETIWNVGYRFKPIS